MWQRGRQRKAKSRISTRSCDHYSSKKKFQRTFEKWGNFGNILKQDICGGPNGGTSGGTTRSTTRGTDGGREGPLDFWLYVLYIFVFVFVHMNSLLVSQNLPSYPVLQTHLYPRFPLSAGVHWPSWHLWPLEGLWIITCEQTNHQTTNNKQSNKQTNSAGMHWPYWHLWPLKVYKQTDK